MAESLIIKPVPAISQIEKLDHEKLHVEILMRKFPNLQVHRSADGTIDYYSESINTIADALNFTDANMSGYTHYHYANPYKEMKINCLHCDEDVKVRSIPSRVLVFNYYGSDYFSGEHLLYSAAYEDFLKQNNFSQEIIGKCHLYILNFLDTLSTKKVKLAERYLNNSCEKLLPFM